MSDTQVEQPDLEPQGEATDTGPEPEMGTVEEPPIDYLDIDDELGSKHVRVSVDGEELSVPLSELTQGYSRQADYTRKTQDLARQRQEYERDLQIARAVQTDPGMAMRILASQAGMPVEQFLGLTPAQQQAAVDRGSPVEDEYADPLERALAEERQAREALEQRILQREADEVLARSVNGLKQQFQIDDNEAREVVATAYQMGLPPQMLPMVYQSMAFQRMQAQNQARQEVTSAQQAQDEQRRAAAAAAGQTISQGTGAVGVQGTPVNQEFTNYRDAIMDAFAQHGDIS